MQPGRRRQPSFGVMLLIYQIFSVIGIDRIPPVTLGSTGLQIVVFLRLFKLPWYNPSQVCVSAYRVWRKKEYFRLIYGAIEHGDEWHLYYNMISFVWKGISLERKFGSFKFAYILSVFTVLTNIVLVALHILSSKYFGTYEDQCAVGFSGVIFALKVLTTSYNSNSSHQVMGIPIILPARYAVWAELILIQLFVPNASFYGHLAGILVGLAYVNGPLKFIMDLLYSLVTGLSLSIPSRPQFTPHAGPSGYANTQNNHRDFGSGPGSSHQNFNDYVPSGMSEEEQVRQAMEESMRDERRQRNQSYGDQSPPPPGFVFGDSPYPNASPPPPGFTPDIEELRNRRQARFTNS